MYIQNINGIKAVAIMLDGCVLDLNKYRLNYYKNICQEHQLTVSKQEFYDSLNSQYTMYNSLPLSDKYKSSQLNQKIEDELYTYLQLKGVYPKEGLFELLEYFKQKDIQVAIMSTHRTKRAVEYLQLTRVFPYVHFVIGSDTKYKPLPSTEMLEAITNQFQIKSKDLLVISPFLSLNMTANDFGSPVIYYKDLVEPTAMERASSIKIVKTFFEILNYILLERTYDSNIYSSMLGMSSKMSKEELDKVNEHLNKIYGDDQQILGIVKDTYEYHLSQLKEKTIKKEEIKEAIIEESTEEFKQDIKPIIKEEVKDEPKKDVIKEEIHDSLIEDTDEMIFSLLDDDIEDQLFLSKEDNKKNRTKETENKQVLSINKEEELELTAAWDKLMSNENIDIDEEDIIYEYEEENDKVSIMDYLVYIFSEFIYSFAISFVLLAIGVVVILVGKEFFMNINPLMTIFNSYLSLVDLFVSLIFNSLHVVFNSIPKYSDYLMGNHILSNDGLRLLHILLFNSFVVFVIKMIILIVKGKKALYEDDE